MSIPSDFQYTKVKSLVRPLLEQITKIQYVLSQYKQSHFVGALLFGSCSRGQATYRSDIDIMLIFAQDDLNFSFVQKTRDQAEWFFAAHKMSEALCEPLQVEFQVVRNTIFNSKEPATIENLHHGKILVDPSEQLKRQMETLDE
jgi:predicted nucleotidyltransferase